MTPFYIAETHGKNGVLKGDEARHCIKVMRKKSGDRVVCVDGKGHKYVGKITSIGKNLVELQLEDREDNWGEKALQVHLLVSPLHKADRFEWLVEKAVELGVTDLHPYLSKHTVKTGLRPDRLERIMVTALKQCLRSRLPVLHPLKDLETAVAEAGAELKFAAHQKGAVNLAVSATALQKANSVCLVVGPEGDFAEEEMEVLRSHGYGFVVLGENRLRSETAAIHMLGLVKFLAGY